MGQSSTRLTILHRFRAKVNTVNDLFSSQRPPRTASGTKEQKVNWQEQDITRFDFWWWLAQAV